MSEVEQPPTEIIAPEQDIINPPTELPEEPISVAEEPKLVAESKSYKPPNFLTDENEFFQAKAYLSNKIGVKHPISLYDHLTSVIMQAMEKRSLNVVDGFEQLSMEVKKQHFLMDPTNPTQLKKSNPDDPVEAESGEIPDMMDLAALWEWAGVSFGKEETYLLFLSIKKLVETKQLKSSRLWGKISGRDQNYIVVEAELKEGTVDEEDLILNGPATEEKKEGLTDTEKPVLAKDNEADVPIPKVKTLAPLSREIRTGVNKYIYYVCNYGNKLFTQGLVGGPWHRLPDVLPERLQEARKIRKFFTGRLNTKIVSFPEFKGTEAHYLRCQIARISAATVVSPKGYYMIDPEQEESEDNNGSPPVIINPEYEGLSNEQLLSVANWVHHVPYILPQGRVSWEAPKYLKEEVEAGNEDEEKDDDEGEEDEAPPGEAETGPPPLGMISADEGKIDCLTLEHGSIPSWSSRVCANASPLKFSPITLRSNMWPGASVLAYNDKFANLYVGDGLKDIGNPAQHFIPPKLGPLQKEYVAPEATPDILVEQLDPTVEREEAYEEEKRAKDEEGKEEGEEGEEAEEDE
ncbi:Radial spoke head protein 4 A [Globomyces sp. JEL0801]|nr:Radial spoke head protein 4 A [Globomyces sp. JEL0801]